MFRCGTSNELDKRILTTYLSMDGQRIKFDSTNLHIKNDFYYSMFFQCIVDRFSSKEGLTTSIQLKLQDKKLIISKPTSSNEGIKLKVSAFQKHANSIYHQKMKIFR